MFDVVSSKIRTQSILVFSLAVWHLTEAQQNCTKCSGYTCDEWIKWNRKYTCQNLVGMWGCNCTGCKSCNGPTPEWKPADLIMLEETHYPDARCLDGSMSGYYVRKGISDKFLIYFEGGGWCYDAQCKSPTQNGTLANCRSRSKQRLGSSRRWWKQKDDFSGMLSGDAVENPIFHNWTLVYLPYCDGTSWSGNATIGGLYFKGKPILDSIINNLLATTRIKSAPQVVIGGGSAGASAVFYHSDSIAQHLRLEHGEVLALPDAGFFLNLNDKDGIDCWPAQMRSVFEVANGYDSLHDGCLERFPQEKWRCMFPQYYADLISTRTLSIMSLYDSSELFSTLRLDCCPAGCRNYKQCPADGKEMQLFSNMRDQHMKAWAPLTEKLGNGVFSPACVVHTSTWSHWTDQNWEVPAGSGNTQAKVVGRWLSQNASHEHFIHQDAVAWPQNRPCSGSDAKRSGSDKAVLTI